MDLVNMEELWWDKILVEIKNNNCECHEQQERHQSSKVV